MFNSYSIKIKFINRQRDYSYATVKFSVFLRKLLKVFSASAMQDPLIFLPVFIFQASIAHTGRFEKYAQC